MCYSLLSFSYGVSFSILFLFDSLACFAVCSRSSMVSHSQSFALLQTRFLLYMPSLPFSVVFLSRLFLSLVLRFSNLCPFLLCCSKARFNFPLFRHLCSIVSLSTMENKQPAMAVSKHAESGLSNVCGNLHDDYIFSKSSP